MYQRLNLASPPQVLSDYLEANLAADARALRRRAVLVQAPDETWQLLCCTVEALPIVDQIPKLVESRRYPGVLLLEEWLTVEQCSKFIENIQVGHVSFDSVIIKRKNPANWQMELLPLRNIFMTRSGYCVSTRFEERGIGYAPGPLLAQDQPYYPNVSEAARDWLPFPVYHGDSDSRRQEIIFLLPESRAYFSDAHLKEGVVEIGVSGTDVNRMSLTVKGAYWQQKTLRHFESVVQGGRVIIHVPEDVDRLEYVLVDERGGIYDFQREDRFGDSGLGMRRPDKSVANLAQRIMTACLDGEGMHTEFKPFIECEDGIGPRNRKTKFRELVTTVVSFANAQGGCIYIGIDDECAPSGVAEPLAKWAKAKVSEEVAYRYCRVLTAKLRDNLNGDIPLRVSHAFLDGAPIVMVDVSPSPAKPVAVTGDNLLYVRAGASNRQLPPDQWPSYFSGLGSDDMTQHGDEQAGR